MSKAEEMGLTASKPPKVTLEYYRVTSSLNKVTKIRIKMGEKVTTFQNEENLLSLTQKRRRLVRGISTDDKELVADLVSIVQSTNKMSEEAIERM